MAQRAVLSQADKEKIYYGKLKGQTLADLAQAVGCSTSCARKWWRRGRDEGLHGLRQRRQGRRARGILSQFEPAVSQRALQAKRAQPGWGARRVLLDLQQAFKDKEPAVRLPSISRLATFFKDRCPECVASPKAAQPVPVRPPRARGVHEIWQLDSQEGIKLHDGQIVTLCNIRDEIGCAQIGSQAFSVKTSRRWRKLSLAEIRQVLRQAFTEWGTLPDVLLTDNELGLAGHPTDPYPALLTQWLVGLGIVHRFIRPGCPKDQAQVERSHQIMDKLALSATTLTNLSRLQQALDTERQLYNHRFPARAGDCAGRPPLVAHPDLLRPRRPYQPEAELSLFSLQRVADYLAGFTFARKVNATGQISLARHLYSVGRPYAGQTVQVRFDPDDWLWVITALPEDGSLSDLAQPQILARRVPHNFSIEAITGLNPHDSQPTQPIQLTFPCFIA